MPSIFSFTIRAKKSLKALAMGSKAPPGSEGILPLDCIFACSICGDVFSDIYRKHDTVHGLSDSINVKDRIVTRLYVTSCCHVICIKHIGGGSGEFPRASFKTPANALANAGPAFHQANQQPQAPCPVCVEESGDDTARQLFSVRGFNEDEHDPAIPKLWFKAPPMKLEGRDQETEALRFQYLALIRFSRKIATSYRHALKSGTETEAKVRSTLLLAAEGQEKVKSVDKELERLRPLEGEVQRLHRLEARLPATRHYLGLIPKLIEQNTQMQQRLASLGFAMSLEPMPSFNEPFPFDEVDEYVEDQEDHPPMDSRKTGSSHTVGRSANTLGFGEEMEEAMFTSAQQQRPLKRSRIDSPARANNIHAAPSSRDVMPPPCKPLSKMKSIRKIIPNLRNRFTNGRSSEAPVRQPASGTDVRMYDNGQWEAVDNYSQLSEVNERLPTRHSIQSGAPYMTGALPVDSPPVKLPEQSGFLSGLGIHSNESDFTFESTPILKMHNQRPGKLPTDPSYIRLLDGLGQHTGLNLGLEDPRHRTPEDGATSHSPEQCMRGLQQESNDPQSKLRSKSTETQKQNIRKQWKFDHTFLQHPPINGNPTSAYRRSGPDHDQNNGAMVNNSLDRIYLNPITPAPVRPQRPINEVDHVVSPFFGSSSNHSQPFSRSQFAEPDISSRRSAIYQSRHDKPSMDTDWREPRSLNGLSFFDSPVNERNERIDWRREPGQQVNDYDGGSIQDVRKVN
ncbi:hypothetical protein SLS60_000550 [Paraconiothyrium brasiliense]|uniref:C2H2-type domain-containing protein n=1 Tax=Paraconiothyrium brasiliense TaxID=300254 RepID=A0ABR3S6I8_9PLEO